MSRYLWMPVVLFLSIASPANADFIEINFEAIVSSFEPVDFAMSVGDRITATLAYHRSTEPEDVFGSFARYPWSGIEGIPPPEVAFDGVRVLRLRRVSRTLV